jgi:shikimate kinase
VVKSISENALKNNNNTNKETKTESARIGLSAGHAPAVILIGFMGAGKSSVGRALAEQLGWAFEDLDERIEQREKQKVAGIFHNSGESGFRQAEQSALKELLEELRGGPQKVIALGGGAFIQEANARLIEAANIPTVFLDAKVEELWARCQRQSEQQGLARPLLGSPERFRALYQERRPHYLRASFKHETGGKAVAEIAAELVHALGLGEEPGGRGANK